MPDLPHGSDPMAASRPIEVAAGLLFRKGRLLITQRRPHDHLGGLWEFPGGKREVGESFEICLRRELKEELGLQVEPGELIDSVTHSYPEKTVHLRFYRCRCSDGEPVALGCEALAWITAADLERYVFPAADQQIVRLLQARPELWRDDG